MQIDNDIIFRAIAAGLTLSAGFPIEPDERDPHRDGFKKAAEARYEIIKEFALGGAVDPFK